MAWGKGGPGSSSSTVQWSRLKNNELEELYILPIRKMSPEAWDECIKALLQSSSNHPSAPRRLHTLSASGHAIPLPQLQKLASILAETSEQKGYKVLSIGGRTLGDDGVSTILSSFGQRQVSLESWDMSFKGITAQSILSLLSWALNKKIFALNLSRNSFAADCKETTESLYTTLHSIKDAGALADRNKTTTIQTLDLSQCDISDQIDTEDELTPYKLLATLVSQARSIVRLDLSHNPLGTTPDPPSSLWSILPPSPQVLNLSNCQLKDDALEALIPLKSLRSLDVSSNQLSYTGGGVQILRQGLTEHWPELISLNLAGNLNLGPEGIQQLALQIQESGSLHLEEIDVAQTNCGVEGARAMLDVSFFGCHRLKSLRLFGNQLGTDGLASLASCWENWGTTGKKVQLEFLDLAGNEATEEAVVSFLLPLASTSSQLSTPLSLQTVVVGGNQGGTKLEALVAEIRQRFPALDIARDKLRQHNPPSGTV